MTNTTCAKCGAVFQCPTGLPGRPRKFCDGCRYVAKPRRPRRCLHCKVDISTLHGLARYCSPVCRNAKKYAERARAACGMCGEPSGYMASRAPDEIRCLKCRRTAHGTVANYRRGCRCDVCRAANTSTHSAYVARRREKGSPIQYRAPSGVRCVDCDAILATGRGKGNGAPRCSPCGIAHRQKRRRLTRRRSAALRKLEDAARGTRGSQWPFVAGVCAECCEAFVRRGAPSRFCSSRCRRKGRKKWISTSDRLAIYERDGWVCQLCFGPVARNAHHLDDWYPTLDHVVPQSWTPDPDHSPENLRTAHRWCNSVRGDGTYCPDFFKEAS